MKASRSIIVRTCLVLSLLVALVGMLPPVAVQAADWIVTNTSDNDPGSLRQAIAAANPGDTITFDLPAYPETITLTSGELLIDKDLTITGPGADDLTIGNSTLSDNTARGGTGAGHGYGGPGYGGRRQPRRQPGFGRRHCAAGSKAHHLPAAGALEPLVWNRAGP